jgi:hypothetical protein
VIGINHAPLDGRVSKGRSLMNAIDRAQSLIDEAEGLFASADAQGRELSSAERIRIKANLDEVARLKGSIQVERIGKAIGSGGDYVTMTDPNSGAGFGWNQVAQKLRRGQKKIDISEAGTADRSSLSQGPGAGKFRSWPFCDHLVEHRMDRDDENALVFGPFDPGSLTERADAAWEKAGLKRITLHALRHAFASVAIASGHDIKALSTFMGHSSITVTLDRYGHLLPGAEDEAAELMNAYIERQRAATY